MTTIRPSLPPEKGSLVTPGSAPSASGKDHLGDPPPPASSEHEAPSDDLLPPNREVSIQDAATEESVGNLPKLLTWFVSLSRGTASKATALLTAATGLTSGLTQLFTATTWAERVTAALTAAGVLVSTVLLFLVMARGDKGVVAGHFARAMVVVVTIGYGAITLWAVRTNLGPDSAWVRMLSGFSLVLLMSTFALAARSANREPAGPEAAYARIQKILFFLLGTAVFGAGTALIGRGLHDAHGAFTYEVLPPFVEGALVCVLGLALLLARRVAAAIVTIGAGVMITIFGIASIIKGELDFGGWTVCVGSSAILVGVGFYGQLAKAGKVGFAAGAISSAGVAVYAFNSHTMAFCLTMCAVTAVLVLVAVVLITVPVGVWQFETSDDERPWRTWKVIIVGASLVVAGLAIGILTVSMNQTNSATTVAQFAGVSVSLVTMGILIFSCVATRTHCYDREPADSLADLPA
jgi:hypothetical protein